MDTAEYRTRQADLRALAERVQEEWVELYHDTQGTPAYGPARERFEELAEATLAAQEANAQERAS